VIYLFARFGIGFDFINPWLGIPALVVMVFVLSALTAFVLQKIPFVKKIVPS
jgi:surface polysaccharide O-acyltransferase-like enzyme